MEECEDACEEEDEEEGGEGGGVSLFPLPPFPLPPPKEPSPLGGFSKVLQKLPLFLTGRFSQR